jgi:prepilin peptidase CpaA
VLFLEILLKKETIVLMAILSIAIFTDIRNNRIPNWLTFSTMIFGLMHNAIILGLNGFVWSFVGLLLGMAFFIILYAMGGTGAGDVKLMGGVGAFLGPVGVINAFLWTALTGGLYALAMILFHPRLKPMRAALIFTLLNYFSSKSLIYNRPDITGNRPKLCYGVAIAIGTTMSLIFRIV